ncbi:MAG: Tim44-like domain-containing protein [Rubrivivax sp.]
MRLATLAALGLALTLGLTAIDADAKRLGGGKSTGMQREMPARTAPDAAPAKPAAPAPQQAAPAQAPAAAATPPAAPPKRNWMGPLAGLAAGLGLAALMSHLGLGEAFGSFLLIALLAVVAVVVIRMLMRRREPQPAGMAYSGSGAAGGAQVAWPPANAPAGTPAATPLPAAAEPPAAAAGAPLARAFVPAAFDSEGFARTAKMIFIRLQAANDAGDLEDLRAFTTPEMFAELSLDLQDRKGQAQKTEVLAVESEVLDVTDDGTRQVVSVRFRGQVREEAGVDAVPVDEVWHLVKPADGSRNWAIAGIEQWKGNASLH